jgi:hypothetical protein
MFPNRHKHDTAEVGERMDHYIKVQHSALQAVGASNQHSMGFGLKVMSLNTKLWHSIKRFGHSTALGTAGRWSINTAQVMLLNRIAAATRHVSKQASARQSRSWRASGLLTQHLAFGSAGRQGINTAQVVLLKGTAYCKIVKGCCLPIIKCAELMRW